MIHSLKIEQRWFDRIMDGTKTAELRLNDRDFQAGDTLNLTAPDGRFVEVDITHVLNEVDGLYSDYAILSFLPVGARYL
ncbi:MAG: DUF3850 domain-containing protein [Candidatus Nanopelagicales bacterium]